ncbi:MAG: hypothetical protein NZZ41_00195 [Candidatus Dojkabacteria bacterium]|nr:hypothetical protein [Candidatus Dojkabacteria bacterium]
MKKIEKISYWIENILYLKENEKEKYIKDINSLSLFFIENNINSFYTIKNYLKYMKSKKILFNNWKNKNFLLNFLEYYRNTQELEDGLLTSMEFFEENLKNTKNIKKFIENSCSVFYLDVKSCNISAWFIKSFEKELCLEKLLGEYNYKNLSYYYDSNHWNKKYKIFNQRFMKFKTSFLNYLNDKNLIL